MGEFSRAEWHTGMKSVGVCASLDELKRKLGDLRAFAGYGAIADPEAVRRSSDYRKFWSYCFQFALEPGKKNLGMDETAALLDVLIGGTASSHYPLLPLLVDYLRDIGHTFTSRDLWEQTLEFLTTVKEDFSNFADNDSWPCVLDDFAERSRSKTLSS